MQTVTVRQLEAGDIARLPIEGNYYDTIVSSVSFTEWATAWVCFSYIDRLTLTRWEFKPWQAVDVLDDWDLSDIVYTHAKIFLPGYLIFSR